MSDNSNEGRPWHIYVHDMIAFAKKAVAYADIGARNRLAHGYLSMNDDLIWSMIQDAIPNLLPALQRLLDTTGQDATITATRRAP